MTRTYVFTGAAGGTQYNDWNFEADTYDNNGHIVRQVFNWSVYPDGTLQGGSALDSAVLGLFANDPLPTTLDNAIIGPAGAYANFAVVINNNDNYGNPARVHDLYIKPSSSLTINGTLQMSDALISDGTVTVNGYHGYTGNGRFIVSSGTTTFSGAGLVRMNAFGTASTIYNSVSGTTGVLENNTTIAGGGMIGVSGGYIGGPADAYLVLHNHGAINADSGTDNIVLSPGTNATETNDGLMEATGNAGLLLFSTNLDQTGAGTLAAYGAGSHVDLAGAVLRGGTIDGSGGGVVQTGTNGGNGGDRQNTLDGRSVANGGLGAITITAGGTVLLNSSDLYLTGSIINRGKIEIAPLKAARIKAEGVTLDGGGQVVLDAGNNYFGWLTGAGGGTTLHNVGNTIGGNGTIGANGANASDPSNVIIDNQASGIINANVAGGSVNINSTSVTNAGLLEGTLGSLEINATTITQTSTGIIKGDGANGFADLNDYTTVYGGKLVTANGGFVRVGHDGSYARVTLDGSTAAGALNNLGSLVDNYGVLTFKGSIVNAGSISIKSYAAFSSVTLTGGGQVVLSSSGAIVNDGGGTLVNTDNTISGDGLFNTNVKIDNLAGGTINGNSANSRLLLYQGQTLRNAGLIEATGAAGLAIIGETVDNSAGGGRLLAANGSHLTFDAATILGGTLQSSGSGYFDLDAGNGTRSYLANVTSSALVKVGNNRQLILTGTTTNSGQISIDNGFNSSGAGGYAILNAQGTLAGGGQINLANRSDTLLYVGGLVTSDNIIQGAGSIYNDQGGTYSLTNNGTIDAIYTANALTIATRKSVTNNGILEAKAGILIVSDPVTGTGSALITGGGTISFASTFNQAVTFQGANAGTLSLSQAYAGKVTGFVAGDRIDLTNIGYNASYTKVFTRTGASGGTLAIKNGATTVASLAFAGSYDASAFTLGNDGSGHELVTTTGPVRPATVAHDLNADGTSDVLLQSGSTVVDWTLQNGQYQAGNVLANSSGFQVVGSGDFNADGTADVLLQSGSTVVDWLLQNGTYQSGNVLANSSGYQVVGTGDFNGDGTTDVLLQNGSSVVDWLLQNGQYQSGNVLANSSGYQVVGTGDFNGDGTTDVLLQNGNSVVDWLLQNGAYQSGNVLANSSGYQVVGTGDFNGDGTTDVLLQNGSSVIDWILGNGAYQSGNAIANSSGYGVVGTGDYNGDGTTDILLQSGSSVVQWTMGNGAYQSGAVLANSSGFAVKV